MTGISFFQAAFSEHLSTAMATERALGPAFSALVDAVLERIRRGGKVLFFGNGGSAADAQHLATELTARFEIRERPAIAAIALTCDTSTLTAVANDWSVERMFSRQVEALGRPGDVAVGISTSGNSSNVNAALRTARDSGLLCVGFSGRDGGAMAALVDHELRVPATRTTRIQEMHIVLGHVLCQEIEQRLYGDGR
ncbi:MAG: D-sedoheptulose 7-phosphate isomerase [Defluviimonas sp.]|uniref:D-sedoheptulose-7-phosphate isomerase n=1 Tax=Albidovulum sp. TaxID=1872424 RepID=UPI002A2AEABF|nr:D-sedoheptulose 7-phosphate isomerase [Defluviimonas sp.]